MKFKILVVDDQKINRVVMTHILKNAGYDVLLAKDGKEAIEKLIIHQKIDLITLDIDMPVLNGFDTLKEIRTNKKYSNMFQTDIPVIFVSSMDTIDKRDIGLSLGATHFINKRELKHKLVDKVKTILTPDKIYEDFTAVYISSSSEKKIITFLEELKLNIESFASFEDAKIYMKENLDKCHIVVIDNQIDGCYCDDFCNFVRKILNKEELPIILISEDSNKNHFLSFFEHGLSDYISKPLMKKELQKKVGFHLSNYNRQIQIMELNKEMEEKNRILHDEIEQRKKTEEELKSTRAQMIMSEKLASIGQLAAGVAHELNNPIGYISTNFEVLKRYFKTIREFINEITNGLSDKVDNQCLAHQKWINQLFEDKKLDFILEDSFDLLEENEFGLENVSKIVKNLKNFSRVDSQNTNDYLDINNAVEETLNICKNSYKYFATIEKDLQENISTINCNAGEINQVLLNLVLNSVDAIKEKEVGADKIIKVSTWSDKQYVYCSIADNGIGIPEEIQSKIFDPFFTTKEVGKGTGLGLNISYNIIVNKHKGKFEVESEEGKGTKFTICLPNEAIVDIESDIEE